MSFSAYNKLLARVVGNLKDIASEGPRAAKGMDSATESASRFTPQQEKILENISKMYSASANGAEEVKKFIHAIEQQALAYQKNDGFAAAYWSRRIQEIAAFIRAQNFDNQFDPTQFVGTYNKGGDPFGTVKRGGGGNGGGGTKVGVGIGGRRTGGEQVGNTFPAGGITSKAKATGHLR